MHQPVDALDQLAHSVSAILEALRLVHDDVLAVHVADQECCHEVDVDALEVVLDHDDQDEAHRLDLNHWRENLLEVAADLLHFSINRESSLALQQLGVFLAHQYLLVRILQTRLGTRCRSVSKSTWAMLCSSSTLVILTVCVPRT